MFLLKPVSGWTKVINSKGFCNSIVYPDLHVYCYLHMLHIQKMKTSVYIGTSLDGFIAGKDGDIEWLTRFADDEALKTYEEFIRKIDAIVIGRGTVIAIIHRCKKGVQPV